MHNLTKIRGKHGMTQTELGKIAGMTRAGMSYLEKSHLTAKNAQKFAEILGENVFDILGEDVFKILPKTEEDKEKVINIILNIGIANQSETSFSKKVRELRKEKGFTYAELEDLTGLSKITLCNIEHGRSIPTALTISKLASALDYEYESLYELTKETGDE